MFENSSPYTIIHVMLRRELQAGEHNRIGIQLINQVFAELHEYVAVNHGRKKSSGVITVRSARPMDLIESACSARDLVSSRQSLSLPAPLGLLGLVSGACSARALVRKLPP